MLAKSCVESAELQTSLALVLQHFEFSMALGTFESTAVAQAGF